MIITFDGTTSSGKSSIAKELSKQTKICYVSTGSIYRALTRKCLNLGVAPDDNEKLKFLLETTNLEYYQEKDKNVIKVDGLIQSPKELHSPEVSNATPLYASKDFVRAYVRGIQKFLAKQNTDIIVEGRDIGSVVFPDADFKFFVDADLQTRAERRFLDYVEQDKVVPLSQVIKDIEERDNQDREREHSPLVMTQDAIFIDTTNLTLQESVDKIRKIIDEKTISKWKTKKSSK